MQRATEFTHVVLQVEPRLDGLFDVVDYEWDPLTLADSWSYLDAFGNVCRRLTLPPGDSVTRYRALVEVPAEPDASAPDACENQPSALPNEALVFTLPSRFCPSDELGKAAWQLFGQLEPGWSRVQAINDWVHNEVSFGYGSSVATTTALDVYATRRGVCRDYAQLAITFCRALGIPARYAFGYLPEIGVTPVDAPMDFCAWTEVYLGNQWWVFDPRNNERRVGRVLIGRGRDALDVAMVSTFGAVDLRSMQVWADEVAA